MARRRSPSLEAGRLSESEACIALNRRVWFHPWIMPHFISRKVLIALAACGLVVFVGLPGEMRRSLINKAVSAKNQMVPLSWRQAELAEIKFDMTVRNPNLWRLEGRKLVTAIQQLAHEKIRVGSSPGDLEGSLFETYQSAVVSGTTSYSCQGLNLIFRAMLTAFGIPNRTVQFYAEKEQHPGQIVVSHSTADVLIEGKWEAIDATFNFHLEDAGGRRLNWEEAYGLRKQGKPFSVVSDNGSRASDPLAAAGVVLDRDLNYLAIIGREIVLRPEDWDGTYRIVGQLHWNVAKDSFSSDANFPLLAEAH